LETSPLAALAAYWLRRSDRAAGVLGFMEAELARQRAEDGDFWDAYREGNHLYEEALAAIAKGRRGRICDGERREGEPCGQPLGPSYHTDGNFFWHTTCRPPRGTVA